MGLGGLVKELWVGAVCSVAVVIGLTASATLFRAMRKDVVSLTSALCREC